MCRYQKAPLQNESCVQDKFFTKWLLKNLDGKSDRIWRKIYQYFQKSASLQTGGPQPHDPHTTTIPVLKKRFVRAMCWGIL